MTPRPSLAPGLVLRGLIAVALLVGGLVHLQLYYDGYRDIPDPNLGRSFLLNVLASMVLAVAVVARRDRLVRMAAAGLGLATLGAFALSRTGDGIFGFAERGLEPTPQAAIALVAELAVIVLVVASFLPALRADQDVPLPAVGVTALALLALTVVAGALWAREDAAPAVAGPESTAAATTTTAVTTTSTSSTTTTSTTVPDTTDTGATTEPGATTSIPPTTMAPTTTAPTPTTAAPAAAPATEAAGNVVRIVDFAFDAPTLTVPVGTTVEWTNEDSFAHSVVADDGSFESERLEPGDTFSFTFETAGDFSYICGLHPSMVGNVTVTA